MSDGVRLVLVVGGVLLVVGAVLWRFLTRRHEIQVLQHRLEDADPKTRARGGIGLVDLGLSRAARPLLAHVVSEPDARVRLAIALAVGRRQWEPNNAKRVKRVREWASLELEQQDQPMTNFGPAVTRLADMGGPRPTTPWSANPTEPVAESPSSPTTATSSETDVEEPEIAAIQWGADPASHAAP